MFEKIPSLISKSETISHIGKIENVVGMSMEASGGRSSIGDIVMISCEEESSMPWGNPLTARRHFSRSGITR